MEVHHHPKVEKKNFKEYFLEFIMIFLAVLMGFFAESLHEHYNNAETEKRNMESLLKNLQKDSINLTAMIDSNQNVIHMIDSFVMLKGFFRDSAFQKQFVDYAIQLAYYWYFVPDESAFEQMKSSGTLRLIKRQNITDSILKYIEQNKAILFEQAYVDKWFQLSLESLRPIVNFREWAQGHQVKLIGTDEQIEGYFDYKLYERSEQRFYVSYLKIQLANVRTLIPFLKKEYGIK